MDPTSIQINIWAMPGGPSANPERTVREAGVTAGTRLTETGARLSPPSRSAHGLILYRACQPHAAHHDVVEWPWTRALVVVGRRVALALGTRS